MSDNIEDTDFHLLGLPTNDDSHELRSRIPFELLASRFVEELRTGQGPSIELYAKRFPPHASGIREVFPVLAMLENARITREAQSIRRSMPDRFPFTRLGNCELLKELGRGGMGVVYEARDLHSGHLVAVKILPWRVSIVPEWVERFAREARIAAQLRHRNIVPVFRYGQESGYCFFVMQRVNGTGLDRIIDRLAGNEGKEAAEKELPSGLTKIAWGYFAKIAIEATQALRAAHAAGILHNDIKPGNLLLDTTGRVWVSDFGLSQPMPAVQTRGRSSERGVPGVLGVSGTLKYMAPERLSGHQSAICDIYSMGATLYELCLQRPAFDHSDREVLVSLIREQKPVRPRSVCREIPRGLETIIMNCLAKNPADRYATAEALLTDLLRFSKGATVSSTSRLSFSGAIRAIRRLFPPSPPR